ncbi:hypothetical protein [Gracilimonas mengyeensis]|uniref:Lipoprotein n=1 Tax=Gracilimonas mengyeensis TaxID=1302730 RepID=A0A521FLM1_9BACT|nr:hypothetical protein [Gracilimonas mengyeensis]SMO97108.1 hypothetical protein SAMN06265219_12246 [Gracilimonas mengyeensis]
MISVYKNISSKFIITLALIVSILLGCGISNSDDTAKMIFEYDFRQQPAEWEAFFTNYNVGWEEKMELSSEYRNLPEPLDSQDSGHYISAVNNSDDVKMLFRKQVDGLEANTTYKVAFEVSFATSAPSGCVGIGGAPGEAVKIIADASTTQPQPILNEEKDYYLLNIEQQNDPQQWYQNVIMGHIANSRECEEGEQYEIKTLQSDQHTTVTSDENGRAWLLFGSRSGFEGETELYYTYFKATFNK